MLKQIRQMIVQNLWASYRESHSQMQLIEKKLQQNGVLHLPLDHFAIIDLPSPQTGIPQLSELFSLLGYITRGKDYLPAKQNDFLWMCEADWAQSPAHEALPQVVVADFRLEELPRAIREIIEKYTQFTKPFPFDTLQQLLLRIAADQEISAAQAVSDLILQYLSGRDWPLPTVAEFQTVQMFNELLAWVLVFGRKPNHFTLSVHLLDRFANLADFHQFIENEVQLELNQDGGVIKGGEEAGIAQGSTAGMPQLIRLADGEVELPLGFVEFVWRYPQKQTVGSPTLWQDFFTGFIAQHANRVIESLYTNESINEC